MHRSRAEYRLAGMLRHHRFVPKHFGEQWVMSVMDAAQRIRDAVAHVSHLRELAAANRELGESVASVKRFQAQRFGHTYKDLAGDYRYRAATRFFLTELYGEQNYVERDSQFSRIAGALQRMLPSATIQTAVSLSELHCLSERLDFGMAQAWLMHGTSSRNLAQRYVICWRSVSQRDRRELQLRMVLEIGEELGRLTKVGGLRLMLSAMRAPAVAAGLGSLQHFLESGFDAFKSLTTHDRGPENFLEIIRTRETHLVELLFDGEDVAIRAALQVD